MGRLQFEVYDRANNSLGDISNMALEKSYTLRLNRPSTAKFKVPSRLVSFLDAGDCCLKARLDGNIVFNGIVWFLQDSGDENTAYTEGIAVSPMVWWKSRFARDGDGDFTLPDFMTVYKHGPEILQYVLRNSAAIDGSLGMAADGGAIELDGVDVTGAPVDWPISIGDLATMLTDTGTTDVVETFVDDNDGYSPDIMSVFNAYNGFYGSDLSGSAQYDWWQGNFNVSNVTRSIDMATICNALWYYLGPKVSAQRWKTNITYQGNIVDPQHPLPDPPQAELDALIEDSRARYGKFMDVRVYDTMEIEWLARKLYVKLWQTESRLRVKPRELITVKPRPGLAPDFGLGDIIGVSAEATLRGGFDNAKQRVYEYTVSESQDGVLQTEEIVTSADQESA